MNTKTNKEEGVPVHKYAKDRGVTKQTVYRWIREGKIPKDKVVLITLVVERIRIKE